MLTTENPLLAIWIWTGAIHGRYWFVGHGNRLSTGNGLSSGRTGSRSQKPGIPEIEGSCLERDQSQWGFTFGQPGNPLSESGSEIT